MGPLETYLAWLEASRAPDTDTACALLSDELIDRMLAEFESIYGADLGGCAALTEQTAQLYEVFSKNADVDTDVIAETETTATLFVTYLASGDCGTVEMRKEPTGWIITENSESCA